MSIHSILERITSLRVRVLFLAVGIFCILFPTKFSELIPLIVGLAMAAAGIFAIAACKAGWESKHPRPSTYGEPIVLTLLGLVIFFSQNSSLLVLGVVWGLLGLSKGAREINAFIQRFSCKENFLFPLILGILEIIFGLILIYEPTEHISFHVIILGINMVLFSIKDPAPHKKGVHEILQKVL